MVSVLLYMVAWYDYVNFCCRPEEGGWRRGLRPFRALWAVLVEAAAIFFHFVSRPLHFVIDRRQPEPVSDSRPPVLLVHGFGSASHAFILISRYLKKAGVQNVFSMTWRPILADAESLAEKVARRIEEVRSSTGAETVTVIAHSMGAVIARYAIKNLDAADRVGLLISLGGANQGTRTAAFMPVGRNTLQLFYKSSFMQDLAEGGLTPGNTSYAAIYSSFDEFIIPRDSGSLGEGAVNHELAWQGHMRLLYSRSVRHLIGRELEVRGGGNA
ncbi:MAG: alpha/beta fold hydrolase [Desulfosalsimonadaceae bacterium]